MCVLYRQEGKDEKEKEGNVKGPEVDYSGSLSVMSPAIRLTPFSEIN